MLPTFSRLVILGIITLAGWGCTRVVPPAETLPITPPDPAMLRADLDGVLDFTLRQRRLNTVDHGAWQILHGVLAYQQVFPVQVGIDGPTQSALEYALAGGTIDGWAFEPGDVLDAATGRRGLRALLQAGTKRGQGHPDQWLAILAQANLPLDQVIQVEDQQYTMEDLIRQVQRDVPRNLDQEWSWTLIGLTKYLPTTASWTARDGQTWSIERLVEAELGQDLDQSACGGTHRLIGMAMALERHRANGGSVTGIWQDVEQRMEQAIETARLLQNPDGSFSAHYFERPGQSADLAMNLSTTGHILEFLAIAMPPEDLKAPWVARAADYLCQLFRQTESVALECGALYHAAHGMVLYRERVFGSRAYSL